MQDRNSNVIDITIISMDEEASQLISEKSIQERDVVNIGKQDLEDDEEKVTNQLPVINPLLVQGTLTEIASKIDDIKDVARLARVCKFTNGVLQDQVSREKISFFKTATAEFTIIDTKPYNDISKFKKDFLACRRLLENEGSNKKYLLQRLDEISCDNKLRNLRLNPSPELTALITKVMQLKAQLEIQIKNENVENNNNRRISKCIMI